MPGRIAHNTSGKNCAQRKLGMNKRPPWKRNVSDEGVGDLLMIFHSVCTMIREKNNIEGKVH